MQIKLIKLLFAILDLIAPGHAARRAVAIFYAPRKFPAAKWEAAALSSGIAEELEFDGEILDATVWEAGGPTILLVHGWEGRRGQLGKIALALNALGYRVVAFDGPAHGSSFKKQTTLVQFSEAVQAAVQKFGPVQAIVGHSFGAAASAIAVRKGVSVKRLVLISCPFSLRHVVSGFARFVGVPSRSHEKMYPIMQQLHACDESELSFQTIGPDLAIPCLQIHDTSDRYIPFSDAEKVKLTLARGELIKTQSLGHMRILQDEKVVSKVVAFISTENAEDADETPVMPMLSESSFSPQACL